MLAAGFFGFPLGGEGCVEGWVWADDEAHGVAMWVYV